MLNLYPLFSGSSGNMYLVESNNTNVLVDIGISYKRANIALNEIGKNFEDIDALVITHEHSDHIQGLSTLLKKQSIPIYTSKGTRSAIKEKLKLNDIQINEITADEKFNIKDISITPFEISHDAAMPLGYTISSENKSLTIATDLGYVSENIYSHLKEANLSVIESNYDNTLLMYGPYNYNLKQRIKSNLGHLSNTDTASVITNLAKDGKRSFILGHLSQNNNNPDIAYSIITDTLKENGFNLDEFNINIATRDFSSEVYSL